MLARTTKTDVHEQHVYDVAKDLDFEIPQTCPLAPENDVLRLMEENKKEVSLCTINIDSGIRVLDSSSKMGVQDLRQTV